LDLSRLIPEEERFDDNDWGTLQMRQPPIGTPSLRGRVEAQILHKSVYAPIDDTDHDPVIVRVRD
jgi:hypothetical protein